MVNQEPNASREEKELLSALGLDDLLSASSTNRTSTSGSRQQSLPDGSDDDDVITSAPLHPAVKAGLALGLVANLGLLLSLPPVLLRRGAPYLPTFARSSDAMWERIRSSPALRSRLLKRKRAGGEAGEPAPAEPAPAPLTFCDLGSGDGRLVFQAARQNLFATSIGYEINPVLHAFAAGRRLVQAPMYWNTTSFAMRDLWTVPLDKVDVVAVYGLQPIMKDLGTKLKAELRPGSLVVSHVFSIPGWRAEKGGGQGNIFLYSVPDCWDQGSK
mmetsp:Transcript_10560/g.29687  ORF Transcript_10560/g.29687 Transcript_10560/m.29687 type:complete len:272 (-) Transcript_10560:123-938(-)